MSALPELTAPAQRAYDYLTGHESTTALSFVFKIKDTEVNGKKITWRDFTRTPGNEDFRYLQQGHLVDLERAVGEGTSAATPIDTYTRTVAAVVSACAKSALYAGFKARSVDPQDVIWFCQMEIGPATGAHVHLVVGGKGFSSASGKWLLRLLQSEYARWLASCCAVDLTATERLAFRDHVTANEYVTLLQYKHKSTGKHYCKPVDYGAMIMRYFLNKKPWSIDPNQCYVISWDNKTLTTDLSYSERMAIHRFYTQKIIVASANVHETQVDSVEPKTKKKRQVTQRELSTKEIVDSLTKQRIVTLEDWMLNDPDSYIQALTSPGGQQYCVNILEISGLRVSKDFTAFQLITERGQDTCRMSETKTWAIFKLNRYNPLKILHAIMCVLNKQAGKRNTILFYGPATTGKSLLAQTLCAETRNVGCYNPANVNFPFNDCLNKNLIWVEEAGNLGQQVNQFKAVMSGQAIRVDQKGKGSKPLNSTPVIMTTNEDITLVRVGCELRPEHTQPIKDRLVAICLQEKLGGDFGLIPEGEFGRLFRTMLKHGYEPTMASYCAHWQILPTYGEDWTQPPIKDPQEEDAVDAELNSILNAFASDVCFTAAGTVQAGTVPALPAVCTSVFGGRWRATPQEEESQLNTPQFEFSLSNEQVRCQEVSFI